MRKILFPLFVTLAIFSCSNVSNNPSIAQIPNPDDSDQISDVDTLYDFSQGALATTGVITDLAINGTGFFVLKKAGEQVYYRRPGKFIIDSNGYVVLSTDNSARLQAIPLMQADGDGKIVATYNQSNDSLSIDSLTDLRFTLANGAVAFISLPKATTSVRFTGNLDSDGAGLGTVLYSNAFLAPARVMGTDQLIALYDYQGNHLGIRTGDILIISVSNTPVVTPVQIVVSSTTTLEDLRAAIQQVISQISPGFVVVTINPNGTISISNGGAVAITHLQVTSNRPGSNSYVTNAFNFSSIIQAAATVSTNQLLRPAEKTDLLSYLLDQSGQRLGLEDGDIIAINGAIGGTPITAGSLTYSAATTTAGDLCESIQNAFSLPMTDGTISNQYSVDMNKAGTDDDVIPDGAFVVRGQIGAHFALTNVTLTASNSNLNSTAPTRFNANAQCTELQAARDPEISASSVVIYNHRGVAYTLIATFTHSNIPDKWLWEITVENADSILEGNRGAVTFGQDGSPESFTYDDSSNHLVIKTADDSIPVTIMLDAGQPHFFGGLTEFRSPTTPGINQDGQGVGYLLEFDIDMEGTVIGVFSNGASIPLYKIPLAQFLNPGELIYRRELFHESATSGNAVISLLGSLSNTVIMPGAVELEP